MEKIRKYIKKITPRDSYKEEVRNKYVLNMMLVVTVLGSMLVGTVAYTISSTGIVGDWFEMPGLEIILIVNILGSIVILFINNFLSQKLASALFIFMLISIATYSDDPWNVANGRGLLFFSIPILVGSVLFNSVGGYVVAGVSAVSITIFALMLGNVVPNMLAISAFLVLATASWLSTRNLEVSTKRQMELEMRFQKIFENSKDFFFLLSSSGEIVDTNDSSLKFFNHKMSEVEGKLFTDSFGIRSHNKKRSWFYEMKGIEDFHNKEVTVISGSGIAVEFLLSVVPIKDDDGKVMQYMVIMRDIADIKATEAKMSEKIEQLEKMNDLMIGREVKIVELKKEIERLNKIFKK